MENQTVHIVDEVGQRQFGLGSFEADGADKQAEAVFLMSEDMFDPCPD